MKIQYDSNIIDTITKAYRTFSYVDLLREVKPLDILEKKGLIKTQSEEAYKREALNMLLRDRIKSLSVSEMNEIEEYFKTEIEAANRVIEETNKELESKMVRTSSHIQGTETYKDSPDESHKEIIYNKRTIKDVGPSDIGLMDMVLKAKESGYTLDKFGTDESPISVSRQKIIDVIRVKTRQSSAIESKKALEEERKAYYIHLNNYLDELKNPNSNLGIKKKL
jgi:hypothetical protein